mgnify:CR=1 FL=1
MVDSVLPPLAVLTQEGGSAFLCAQGRASGLFDAGGRVLPVHGLLYGKAEIGAMPLRH